MDVQEISQALNTRFARTLLKPFKQAVREYQLIQPGDSIAVCISGGKDSMVLALLLRELQRTVNFTLRYIAMDPGYLAEDRARLEQNAARLAIPLEIFDTDVLRIVTNHSSRHPCFLCAKLRRGHLYSQAQARSCHKIALGHHYDDAISTVLMGLLYGGQVQAMLPRVKAAHYPGMELIRPLYFVRERTISAWAETCDLQFPKYTCPAAKEDTQRTAVRALIASLAAENPQVEANILNAVKNVDTAKLLGWRDTAGSHSFLDHF